MIGLNPDLRTNNYKKNCVCQAYLSDYEQQLFNSVLWTNDFLSFSPA